MSKHNIFQGRDVPFREILIGGRLGGSRALLNYLGMRQTQLHRLAASSEGELRERALAALTAFSVAQKSVSAIVAGSSRPKR